jgi:putative ABC transport system substrate-binding protein
MIGRRVFIGLLGGAATAWPLAARAQRNPAVLRVAYLWLGDPGSDESTLTGLLQGLREHGYVEEQNIRVDRHYAQGSEERLDILLGGIIKSGDVHIIIATGTVVTAAVKKATSTMPVVSVTGDPVGSGLIASMARPGGNISGFALAAGPEIGEKWLELVHEALPAASRVALLWSAANPYSAAAKRRMEGAAARLNISVVSHELRHPSDFSLAFGAIQNERVDAIVSDLDPLTVAHRNEIVEFAQNNRLPAVHASRDFVVAGGLMSYGASIFDIWRQAAGYVARIAKGAKPADLPIQQPTKFELVINLKTAKILGLDVPPTLLARADEVIE